MSEVNQLMGAVAEDVSGEMDRLLPQVSGPRGRVIEAMRYSALGGGKRLRPFLVVATADLFDVPRTSSLRAGAALEMVHCYSLIHDDLPAMDDADTRRGRPSVHKQFDEATAILAGDGLLTVAFEVLSNPETHEDTAVRADLVTHMAQAAGAAGMVGGQMIDLSPERDTLDLDGISELQSLKTGALIKYGCTAGALLGRATPEQTDALHRYAEDLGLAFQVVDDLLDVTGTEEELGKPAGQDEAMDKATFVKLLGIEGARKKAAELVERACAHLAIFDERADPLRQVARFVLERTS